MKLNDILLRVYGSANLVVASVLLLVCLCLGYQPRLVAVELSTSIIICAPPVVALHLVVVLVQRTGIRVSAAWTFLLAAIPLLALIPAHFFAPLVPGNTLVLAALAMLSSYAGLLRHGLSITDLFNTASHQ
jgi:hypothetical protein